jgi:hypothetical protein
MKVEPLVTEPPLVDSPGLVRREVVRHDVHVEFGGDFAVDLVQELDELRRGVVQAKLGDHVARRDVERGEQIDGAVAFVVVRAAMADG